MSKAYVYLGPSRPFDLPIQKNAILANWPASVFPDLEKFYQKHPNFRELFVPVADLAKARAQMAIPGSALAMISAEIKAASDNFKKERS